jgi:hypothetical protein
MDTLSAADAIERKIDRVGAEVDADNLSAGVIGVRW